MRRNVRPVKFTYNRVSIIFHGGTSMCISNSVGRKGANNRADVKTIQILLNLNLDRLTPLAPLAEDGSIGTKTIAAIEEFQTRIVEMDNPTGEVEPGSETLQELRDGLPDQLTDRMLHAVMPGAGSAVIQRYVTPLTAMMDANQINTPLRVAHFLAQIGHESADLRFAEEIASGEAYEGRVDLGNTEPGDGKRFKGRGLIQLTGRANYVRFGQARNRDFITPTNYTLIASDPNLAVDVSCWFWTTRGLNALADSDNVEAITRKINGGLNGIDDRKTRLTRAKCFLVR
jgi:putative chitinase